LQNPLPIMLPGIDKPVQAEKRWSYHNPGGLQNPLLIMLPGIDKSDGVRFLTSHFSLLTSPTGN